MIENLFTAGPLCLLVGICYAAWQVMLAVSQLDKFEWKNLKNQAAFGVIVFCVLAWPLAIAYRPKSIFSVRALAPVDYRTAAYQRERDKLTRVLPHCSSLIRYTQSQKGVKFAEHFFTPQDIQSAIAKPIKRYWRLNLDDADILRWVRTAQMDDPSPVDVPWAWTSFGMLAAEMLEQGLGKTYCVQCSKQYVATDIKPADDQTSAGATMIRKVCPAGHLVFDCRQNIARGLAVGNR